MSLEENIVWGGLYSVCHNRWNDRAGYNSQIYRQAVPVRREDGSIWMQDTYQIKNPCLTQDNLDNCIQRLLNLENPENGERIIIESRDYYHTGNEKLSESKLREDYKLICNLHDYRLLKRHEDARKYRDSDLITRVHLYNRHGYTMTYGDVGVTLVKKDAVTDLFQEFLASKQDKYNSFDFPQAFRSLDEMISLHNELIENGIRIPPKVERDYEICIWMNKRLREMSKEIQEYRNQNAYKPQYKFANTTVSECHQDMARYLKEDCYCPNEIYDASGFSYELLYEKDLAKIIYTDDNYLVIAAIFNSEKGTNDPEIVLFGLADNKITSAHRLDVTQNNIQIVSNIVNNIENDSRFDSYQPYTFPEDIEHLIDSWVIS